MNTLIARICKEHKTGLQLINQPTGSGKTYSVNLFIYEYFTSGELKDKRNIVVVTTNKNNLAFRELRGLFEKSNKLHIFNDIFIYLDSISNIVIENYDESMDECIFKVLGHNPIVGNYLTAIKNIKRSTDANGKESPAVKDAMQRFAKDVEPPFRRMVAKAIKKNEFTYYDRLRFIETTPEWMWVVKLYPSVYTRKKKLFFMSADKFVTRNDTLIDVSNVVYESIITRDAIIFIDEFDSTKNQILSRLVEDSIKNPIDYLDLYQKIYQGGMQPDIDPEFYVPCGDYNVNLKELHSRKMRHVLEVRRRYHLESPVILSPETNTSRSFLFKSDITYVVNSASKSLFITYDRKSKKNIITVKEGKKSNKELYKMFRDIDYAIEDYCRLIRIIAYNYYKKADDPTLSFEDCVYIILDLYGITSSMPSYRNYLHKRVMIRTKPNRIPGVDSSIYEKGYEYFAFLDDVISKERAHIHLVSCLVSAEKVLLNVCERAMVFGVSATAEFKTVLGNYDLEYLKSRLGDRYLPSISNDPILVKQIDNAYGNYGTQKINWDVKSIASGIEGVWDDSLWENIFTDKKHLCVIKDRLNGVNEFYLQRYYSLAFALKTLVSSEKKRNGLFFCNMHPVENSSIFDRHIIKQMFDIIRKEAKDDNPNISDVKLVFLRKDDFDSNKRQVQIDMGNGERAAIITSYGTFSTGQNMQFDIPEGIEVKNVSRLAKRNEMDLDFIYLQTPTHLIHAPEAEEYEKERALHICDIHYLKSNGEITQKECIKAVSSALSGSAFDINMSVGLANDSKSGHMHAAAKLTQAIGRICRTNMKNPEISIYYDEGILRYMDQPVESYGLVSPETEHFYEHCMKDRESPPDIKRLEELAVFRSNNAINIIHDMLGWTDESMVTDYKAIRHDLLCNPSMDELNNTAYQMYVELPRPSDHYWCSYRDEYKDLKISFDGPLINGMKMDTEGLRFNELFTIPGLKDHFIANGYATELKTGRYLISPVAAKNLLMGIHGEVAGCFIIDPKGTILKEMDERNFEKFDFQIDKDVAIDFKHWSNDLFTLSSVQHKKIIKKMKETGHKTVYIVNILLPKGKSKQNMVYEEDGLKIIKVPWLFDPETGQFNDRMISEIRGL